MTTHEVEKMLGITKQALIYYEKEGLIKPSRDQNNYRNYSYQDIDIIKLIQLFRSMEVSIDEIKLILANQISIRKVLETKKEFVKNSKIKLEDIDRKINEYVKRREVKVSFDNVSIEQWVDRDTLFLNKNEIRYNDVILPIDEIDSIDIKMCSTIKLFDLLRVFLNYYVDIDIHTSHDDYSFQIMNNKQVVKMFDYFTSNNICLNDPLGLVDLYHQKDLVSLNKYLDINFKKWAKQYNLDNPRDDNYLIERIRSYQNKVE